MKTKKYEKTEGEYKEEQARAAENAVVEQSEVRAPYVNVKVEVVVPKVPVSNQPDSQVVINDMIG